MIMRAFGIALASASHLLLAVTIWFLFPSLMGTQPPDAVPFPPDWWWIDGLLVVQFGVAHSVLLLPVGSKYSAQLQLPLRTGLAAPRP
jgi:hypothetical protein